MTTMSGLMKVLATGLVVVVAVAAAGLKYRDYLLNPWTRNGQVRAQVIQVAPRVSGPIVNLPIVDNRLVKQGDVLFEIDVHGARQIRDRYTDALLIFVRAPSSTDQEARLRGRGDAEEKIAARLAKAEEEEAVAVELGMTMVVNDDLHRAVAEVRDLIDAGRRSRRSRDAAW